MQGSRVWLTDKEEVWKGGVVVSYTPDDHIVVVDPETEKVSLLFTWLFYTWLFYSWLFSNSTVSFQNVLVLSLYYELDVIS